MTNVYEERIILGPCICQGCHQEVVYCVRSDRHMGWLHRNGTYICPAPGWRSRKVL